MKLKYVLIVWFLATVCMTFLVWLSSDFELWKAFVLSLIGIPFIMMLIIGFIAIVTTIK